MWDSSVAITVNSLMAMLESPALSREKGTTLGRKEIICSDRIYLGLDWSAVAMMSYLYQIILLSIVILLIRTLPAIRILLIVIGSGIG